MPLELVRKYPYYGKNYSRPYDSNCVRKGDLYELRYWKEGWQSLGLQTAESDNSLRYDSVPRNALLWLHNHSGGVEERIFTYENGMSFPDFSRRFSVSLAKSIDTFWEVLLKGFTPS